VAICRRIAVLLLVFVASPAAADTLSVAWNPSPDQGVTGYRIYIGTRPGEREQFFDVGRIQTSFVYRSAAAGQRYYVSVATQARGLIGPPSAEVPSLPGGESDVPAGQLSTGSPSAGPFAAGASVSLANRTPAAAILDAGAAVGPVSSLVADPAGGALLIESGSRVRVATAAGLGEQVALEAGTGERMLSMALDPKFSDTGHVFVAYESATSTPPQVKVVRYRLLRGVLGEGAKIIDGVPSSGTATRLALSDAGDIFVVPAMHVLRFSADGTVPREQASRSALWAGLESEPEAALWDSAKDGLWVVGRTPSGARASWLVREGAAGPATELERTPETGRDVVMSRQGTQVLAHTATAKGLASTDLSSGVRVSAEPLTDAAFVSWTAAVGGAFLVVAPERPMSDGQFRLLHLSQ